jgi:hypothetical protein
MVQFSGVGSLLPSSEDDAAIGFTLTNCTQTEAESGKQNQQKPFSLSIVDTETSTTHLAPHKMASDGSGLFVRDDSRWYEVLIAP